jgi:nucleoside 2-deoxyribosyltransferase
MIYLASPYSHPDSYVRERRFREACRASAALLRAGISVFSPIAHSHPVAHFGLPIGWEFWERVDREFLSRCDVLAVLMLPGWRESVGVQAEIRLARELGLPVEFIAPSELDDEVSQRPNRAEVKQGTEATLI